MADDNNYFVRPVSGVWHVTWNDAPDLIGSYPCQPEAVGVAELLAKHMRAQGKTAKVHVAEPEVRRATWGRSIVNTAQAAA
ncbi:hypothetical protein [Caulobacter sp. DWR2-3-1b2]|uniref:hypothetical protein n=1 Tax=unclassified Caulobacter TaxID=2648921 RepID=UPI0019BF549C|nr:hypothetical protein [Caulobacter sp.]